MGKGASSASLQVALGAALIGLAPIGLRLSELGPQATAFWRFAFALPLLALLWAREGARLPRGRLPILVIAGVCFGLDMALWHASLTMTSVLNATLLANVAPVLAALAGVFVFRERIGTPFILGAGVAMIGVGVLSYARAAGAGFGAGERGLQGDLVALFSCLWYAAYLVLLRGARAHVTAMTAMAITTATALIVALIATLATGEALLPHTAQGWAVLVALGVIAHVGGQGLIAEGVGKLPISVSTILLWVQPVAAAALSWILFNEALGPLALAGAGLVLGGVWIVQRGRT